MNYIIANWSELNLIDRAWFIVGAWLMLFFLVTFFFKLLPGAFRSKNKFQAKNYPNNQKPSPKNKESQPLDSSS